MQNPYIGKDGKDYQTYQDLVAANKAWREQMLSKKIIPLKKVA